MEKNYRFFRLTGRQEQNKAILDLLADQGFRFSSLPFYDEGFILEEEPFPLGASIAARFGFIYIQDASSMIPALALAELINKEATPGPNCVLDMCASPGGKSSLLARLLGPSSCVIANEPSARRLGTLRRNLFSMNAFNCASSSYHAEKIPLPDAGTAGFPGFTHILLDPPCSGWGTVDKNPKVMEIWKGDKVKPLIGLQRLLLAEAVRLLAPGGFLSYSTCTLNVQENEEQVVYALQELSDYAGRKLLKVNLAPYAGFSFDTPELDCSGTLRVSQDSPLGQGFYIAAFRKEFCKGNPEASSINDCAEIPEEPAAPQLKTCSKRGRKKIYPDSPVPFEVESLASPLCSPEFLPDSEVLMMRNQVNIKPIATTILPSSFKWQGFPLARSSGQFTAPRLESGLRALMPNPKDVISQGGVVLELDTPSEVMSMLSGRSIPYSTESEHIGLYYRGLGLCQLKYKGGRVLI